MPRILWNNFFVIFNCALPFTSENILLFQHEFTPWRWKKCLFKKSHQQDSFLSSFQCKKPHVSKSTRFASSFFINVPLHTIAKTYFEKSFSPALFYVQWLTVTSFHALTYIIPKKVELLIRFFEPFWISTVFHFSLGTFGEVEGLPDPLVASDETYTQSKIDISGSNETMQNALASIV